VPALASHIHKTAKARLAELGDLATAELVQPAHDDQPTG
jgi:hypothetical protein